VKIRFLFLLLFLSGCATHPRPTLTRYEFEKPEMGVPFRIVLYAPSESPAREAADAAFNRVAHLNEVMSDYEYDSELSQLGHNSGVGQKTKVSDELWTVLSMAQKISRASDGAFDVTVGPYIQLWRKARREKKMPAHEALEKARARVGYTNIVLKNHTVELLAKEMRLDLGAIAKGYAADEALRILRAHGIRSALCAASGDMALGDAPPGEKGWKIQLINGDDSRGQPFLILHNCGVANSGDMFQFVDIEGQRYSHIVDPRTGVGLTDRSLVTIVAKNGITADALSTTVSVMGPADGLKLARRFGAEGRETREIGGGGRLETATDHFWKHAMWLK
jgi:thiamine biosynthesis lipoprotein